jgi:hypothetical protein
MTKIEVFDTEAERISEIADIFQTNTAFVVEALFDYIDGEANLLDKATADIIGDYIS